LEQVYQCSKNGVFRERGMKNAFETLEEDKKKSISFFKDFFALFPAR
jgi:hypothetical protein